METIEDYIKKVEELEKKLAEKSDSWMSIYSDLEEEKKKNEDLRTQMRGIGMLMVNSATEKKKY